MSETTPSAALRQKGTPFDLLEPKTIQFYLNALEILEATGIRFAVGGAYALACYAGIVRHTKDLDIFVKRSETPRVMDAFDHAGHVTALTHPHWIAKAYSPDGEDFIDVIYGSGNGLTLVDDEWLAHAEDGEVLGRAVKICPAEEILWSKSFIQERERFDGADVAHLLLARATHFDWDRVLRRFTGHEAVLLSHLIMFGYIYPTERDRIPRVVIDELMKHSRNDNADGEKLCRGTLFSYSQYLVDVNERGYIDPRLQPRGTMTPAQVEQWTNAPK